MAWPGSEDSDSDSESDVLGVRETWVLDCSEASDACMLPFCSLMVTTSIELELGSILLLWSLMVIEWRFSYELGVDTETGT